MIPKLKEELSTDNYTTMTDAEVATALNAENITYELNTLTTGVIYNCVDPAEFSALTADNKQLLRDILSLGEVDVSDGTNARSVILSMFPGGTVTLDNLAAAVTVTTSRAKQIGINQQVMDYHIAEARS